MEFAKWFGLTRFGCLLKLVSDVSFKQVNSYKARFCADRDTAANLGEECSSECPDTGPGLRSINTEAKCSHTAVLRMGRNAGFS